MGLLPIPSLTLTTKAVSTSCTSFSITSLVTSSPNGRPAVNEHLLGPTTCGVWCIPNIGAANATASVMVAGCT